MLVDHEGNPLDQKEKRREMKSAQIKKTPLGDVVFRLTVDLPKSVSEIDFINYMIEYGHILTEAFEHEKKKT